MSGENEEEYDPNVQAMSYGTIWTNALFEPGMSTLKFSRSGVVNIRIPWAAIIWGLVFAIPVGLIAALFLLVLFKTGILGVPIVLFSMGAAGLVGARVGLWSPMQKSTGEDLLTYMSIVMRQRFSRGGGKISTAEINSKAVGGEDGRIVTCTQWLGTQPLRNAPPMSPYEMDFKSEYRVAPTGEFHVIDNSNYRDGLGDRF